MICSLDQEESIKPTLVLIVEDDKNVSDIYALYFKKSGFEVVMAACVKHALEALNKHKPQVLFLDYNLPDGTGLQILEDWPASQFACVCLHTGNLTQELIEQCNGLGVTLHFQKPTPFATMLSDIKDCLKA